MYLFIGIWLGLTVLASIVFHLSTRHAPAAPMRQIKPASAPASAGAPAKLITKREAYEAPTTYDYGIASPESHTTPDSEPPES